MYRKGCTFKYVRILYHIIYIYTIADAYAVFNGQMSQSMQKSSMGASLKERKVPVFQYWLSHEQDILILDDTFGCHMT